MTDIELRLSADVGAATKDIAGFRKEYAQLVKAVEKPIRQIDALRQTQNDAKKASADFFAAKRSVEQLKKAMESAGTPVKGLSAELGRAERALAKATLEFDRQKAKVREQRSELRAAGVDTRNLVGEQQRLQAEYAKGVSAGRNDQAVRGIRAQAIATREATQAQRQANLEQARSNLGVTQSRAAAAEIQRLIGQYNLLRQSGGLTARELAIAQQTLNRRIKESQQSMRELAGEQQRLRAGAQDGGFGGAVGGIGAAYGAASAVGAFISITDSAKKMDAQLQLVTNSQKEFSVAQADTFRIAQLTRAPLEDVVTLYARLSPALLDIGRNQRDVAGVTEALSSALRISGATQAETAATLTQFSQALGSGALRGEEFNSVAEAAPRLMRALAQGLNVPIGSLRELAADGALTADVITDLTLKALPELAAEAASLPDTVEGALTRLRNEVTRAFSEGDTSGFISAIRELQQVLTDPQVVQGLSDLAAGMARLAGWTVQAASEFTGFAKEVAFAAAAASGYIDELAKLEKTLEGVNAARTGGSLIGRPTVSFFMTPEQLDAWAKELEEKIEAIRAKINGVTVEQQRDQEEAAAESLSFLESVNREYEKLEEERVAAMNVHRQEVAKVRDGLVDDIKAAVKKQESAEKAAVRALEKVKKDRLAIEQKYAEASAKLASSGTGDASFASFQDLKLGAQKALRAGDFESASKQADAALQVLLELKAAGENTYGFQGFADQLKGIELEANKLEQTKADEKILQIQTNIAALNDQLKELSDVRINLTLDDAQLEAIKNRMRELATALGQTITIPVQAVFTGAVGGSEFTPAPGVINPDVPSYPGYAAGDMVRGPGTGTSDSILARLSNGEFVMRAAAVRHYGPELLRQLNERRLPRFADGGLISNRSLPSIPQMSQSLLAPSAPDFPDLGRLELNLGGQSTTVYVDRGGVREIQRAATKFGRTHK